MTINAGKVWLADEGTYIFTGVLEDGMIIVDAGDEDQVHIVLDGVDIESATSAAIYVKKAGKVFITTAENSENSLSNSGEYVAIDDSNIDVVIFSKSDLTLNGSGTLEINASAGHGIASKDNLILTGGEYIIKSESHGLSGKDSVRITDGQHVIDSGKDGIHSENSDDDTLGFLYISGGEFSITADGDGMSAEAYLVIDGGKYDITSGSGASNSSSSAGYWSGSSSSSESTSTKGIKAVSDIMINGGDFWLDTEDDE